MTRLVICTTDDRKPRKTQNNCKIMERYRIFANGKLIATARWYGHACAIAYDYVLTIKAREPFKRAPRVQVTDHLRQVLREY